MGWRANIRIPGVGNTLSKERSECMTKQDVFQKLQGSLWQEHKELGNKDVEGKSVYTARDVFGIHKQDHARKSLSAIHLSTQQIFIEHLPCASSVLDSGDNSNKQNIKLSILASFPFERERLAINTQVKYVVCQMMTSVTGKNKAEKREGVCRGEELPLLSRVVWDRLTELCRFDYLAMGSQ